MKPKILLAEDEQSLRELYKTRLELESFSVITASDGRVAIEIAKKEKPDVILLDIMMPQIDGLYVLDNLKENEETKDIPVVMMTVLANDEVKARALRSGAYSYLVKSQITPAKVVELINKILKIKDSGQAEEGAQTAGESQLNTEDQINKENIQIKNEEQGYGKE